MPTPKHFINLADIPVDDLKNILKHAHDLKAQKFSPPQIFNGLTLAMMFDKRSTRTRMSFEVAMKQLGGHTVVMNTEESQIGGAESVESTGKVVSRYVDAIMVRMSNHDVLTELATHSSIPVINGMTDKSHPCQIMASLMTVQEHLGDDLTNKTIAWFGDVNNVTNAYIEAAPIFGYTLVVSCPSDLILAGDFSNVTFDTNAQTAARGADIIVTDTWESMGQGRKTLDKFMPYQVNKDLMAAAKSGAIFTHCLPIHEWEEVTEAVAKSPASVIYDEAENRLHAQKAILAWCLDGAGVSV